jgi:ABC-2 type transport system permease protein
MTQVSPVFKREFLGYFRSPVAYVFLGVFSLAGISLAFFIGNFFKGGEASMRGYFMFYPWLFLFLIPAAGMRLWSEEKRVGTVELLFTLPITTLEAVLGKFLAAWAFLTLAILLSLPLAATVAYLGSPDWGVIASTYLGAILMAGGYLGICSLTSSFTKNQVISFVVSVCVCLVILFVGWSVFTEILASALPVSLVDALANFGFIPHFEAFTKGIIDPRDIIYFLSVIAFTLFLNVVALER